MGQIMKKMTFSFFTVLFLTGCVSASAQSTLPVPPSATQMQAHCFANYKKFLDQTSCIESSMASYYYVQPNSYVQEYMAHMRSLSDKVKKGKLVESDARLQLTQALLAIMTHLYRFVFWPAC